MMPHRSIPTGVLTAAVAVLVLAGCESVEETSSEETTEYTEAPSIALAGRENRGARGGPSNRSGGGGSTHPVDPRPTDPGNEITGTPRSAPPVTVPDQATPDVPPQADPADPLTAHPPVASTEPAPRDGEDRPPVALVVPSDPKSYDPTETGDPLPPDTIELARPRPHTEADRSGGNSIRLPAANAGRGDGGSTVKPIPLRILPQGEANRVDRNAVALSEEAIERLAAMKLPPPTDRLEAIEGLRGHEREYFIVRFDGQAPRLLTRIEAVASLEKSDRARVVLLPLNPEDADAWSRWLAGGRKVRLPQQWATDLQQSSKLRTRRHDEREADLERVRTQRQELREKMYRFLLGDRESATDRADAPSDAER